MGWCNPTIFVGLAPTHPPSSAQKKGRSAPHCEEACVVATGRQEVDAPSEDSYQGNMLGPILGPKPIWIAMRTLTMLRYIFLGGFELDILLSFVTLERGDPNIQRQILELKKKKNYMLKCSNSFHFINTSQ